MIRFCFGFFFYQNVCFLNFRYLLLFFVFFKITEITKSLRLNKCKRNREAEIERGDEDTEKESEKGRGNEMRHEERNKERGRVPKAVHCALQSKGKESRVHLIHHSFPCQI